MGTAPMVMAVMIDFAWAALSVKPVGGVRRRSCQRPQVSTSTSSE